MALVWLILCVLWIADSLKAEYEDRDLPGDGDFGKTMGIVYYALTLFCFPVGIVVLFHVPVQARALPRRTETHRRSARRRRRDEDPYDDEPEDDR